MSFDVKIPMGTGPGNLQVHPCPALTKLARDGLCGGDKDAWPVPCELNAKSGFGGVTAEEGPFFF